MTLTLNLDDEDQRRLAEKAKSAGIDVQTYVECIVRAAASRAPTDQVLQPVRDAFRESGMTEDELGELLEKAKHEMRAERKSRRAS